MRFRKVATDPLAFKITDLPAASAGLAVIGGLLPSLPVSQAEAVLAAAKSEAKLITNSESGLLQDTA